MFNSKFLQRENSKWSRASKHTLKYVVLWHSTVQLANGHFIHNEVWKKFSYRHTLINSLHTHILPADLHWINKSCFCVCHLSVSTSEQSYKTTNKQTSWRPFCVHMLLSLHWPELWEASGNCWIVSLYSDSTHVPRHLLQGRSSLFPQNRAITFSTMSSAVCMSKVHPANQNHTMLTGFLFD